MADSTILRIKRKDYYVYVLFGETGVPFYVGMGSGNRLTATKGLTRYSKSWKGVMLAKMALLGQDVPVVKIASDLTKNQAEDIEIAFIAAIGRHPNGPLVNRTPGGYGARATTPEIREKIAASKRGKPRDKEMMARIHAKVRGRKASIEERQIRSLAYNSYEALELAHDAWRGQKHPPERIEQLRARRRQWHLNNPEKSKAILEKLIAGRRKKAMSDRACSEGLGETATIRLLPFDGVVLPQQPTASRSYIASPMTLTA